MAELNDIFEEFLRLVQKLAPQQEGGSGVGLALCKKVIDLHGGKIWAESNGIQGAIFRITLPLS